MVERPFQKSGSVREAVQDVWEGSGVVGRLSRMSGSGLEAFRMSGSGREILPDVQE